MILFNLQLKLYELLSSNEEITGICKIYDFVPEDKPLPFIVIGEDRAIDFSSKTFIGKEITTTIHIWSDQRGSLQVKKLLGLIEKTLEINFEKGGYDFKYHKTPNENVIRETVELLHGTIEITYRAMEV